MSLINGIDCKMYRLTSGTRASWGTLDAASECNTGSAPASLSEVDNVKDVSLKIDPVESDVTTRRNRKWKATAIVMLDAGIEFEMPLDHDDANYQAFRTAALKRTTIAMAILDGDKATAGSEGLWADWSIVFNRDEALEETGMVSFTLKPGYSSVAPEWVQVS